MKKTLALALSSSTYLLFASKAFAELDVSVDKTKFPGAQGSPSEVLTSVLQLVFVFAGLAVLFFLIIGAFKWITSGGDKDSIGKARGSIVNALIGLAILALSFFIITIAGYIVGIDILNLKIPKLGEVIDLSTP